MQDIAESQGTRSTGDRRTASVVQFGRFRLDTHRRELLADGMPVPIGNRALDTLIVLVAACGELVTKDQLLSSIWPGAIVEENTLQFQISSIRKALGKDRNFIKTVSGRGYRFIAEIEGQADQAPAPADPGAVRVLSKIGDGVWVTQHKQLLNVTNAPERLGAALAAQHLLLLLGNCEHVIDATARLAEALLHARTTLRVIATAQRPLELTS